MNRQIDELGRIVLPKEIRRVLKITTKTLIKIDYNKDKIILTPINDIKSCDYCGAVINTKDNYCYNCGEKVISSDK